MTVDIEIGPLSRSHNLNSFGCGNEKIDNFLKATAWKQHKSYRIRVFAANKVGTFDVCGYYSLTFVVWQQEGVSAEVAAKFNDSKNSAIPAVYLAKLGVSLSEARQGIGAQLIRDAFKRSLAIAEHASVSTLTLEAIDETKAIWYEKLGFQRFVPGDLRMVISLATLRKSLSGI